MSTDQTNPAQVRQTAPVSSPSRLARVLLACGAIGPPLFVVVFLIEGATRPGYSPLRHPVSSLEIGASGWTQRTNFVITGLLILAFAFVFARLCAVTYG